MPLLPFLLSSFASIQNFLRLSLYHKNGSSICLFSSANSKIGFSVSRSNVPSGLSATAIPSCNDLPNAFLDLYIIYVFPLGRITTDGFVVIVQSQCEQSRGSKSGSSRRINSPSTSSATATPIRFLFHVSKA